MDKIGILCGFAAEAAIAKPLSPLIAMSGALEEKARERVQGLVDRGATALLSFGVAGGLEPGLTSHDIILATHIMAANGNSWICDETFTAWLRKGIPQARAGTVFGSRHLVPTPREKKQLYQKSSCTIVDMESHVVAEVASTHGLPFAVLRGVSDGINDTFPKAALVGVNEDGSANTQAMLRSLLLNPFQLLALRRLFRHTGISLGQLSQAVTVLAKAA